VLGEVGAPLALPKRLWHPPQAQGVRLGVERRPLGVLEDEASAIHWCRAGLERDRWGFEGRVGIGQEIESEGIGREIEQQKPSPGLIERGKQTREAGELTVVAWILGEAATATSRPRASPRGRISARTYAYPHISARPRDSCGPPRPRLLCAFTHPRLCWSICGLLC
jgi:hypothetical protein